MIQLPAKGIAAFLMLCCSFGIARAGDPLPAETQLVAASTAAPPKQVTFTIAIAQDLVVTLTDLKVPSALASAGVVVTQAGAVAASAVFNTPAASATASISAASGTYTMYVFGVPSADQGVGSYTACVAPKTTPAACIQSASLSGAITSPGTPNDPTVSTVITTLNVTTQDSYTFTFNDLMFPVALNVAPTAALFQGSTPITPPGQSTPAIASGTSLSLAPGTYQLFAIAQADSTAKAGAYSAHIAGALGSTLYDAAIPVGLLSAPKQFQNATAQPVTLTVADYAFPTPLASAAALLTAGGAIDGPAGGTVVGTASAAGGPSTLSAPAGTLNLFTYGSAGSGAGTYSADATAGTQELATVAHGVGPSGSTYAYAFVTANPITAGAYQASAADLRFPSALSALSFAVAQNGVILQQSATAGTVNFTAVAGNAVLLVSAQPPASGSVSGIGLFDVNLQTTSQLVFDRTQIVSTANALVYSKPLDITASANLDATLTDLKVPAAFDSLGLVISRGTEVLGSIYGGGTFSFAGAPGTYQLTFFAQLTNSTPAATQQFGLYAASVVLSPPTVTLTSSATSAAAGSSITLNWSASNASACTAGGGSWTGNKATTTSSESVVLSTTTTYTLTCSGQGGSAVQSVTVTATAAPAKSSGGGGALDLSLLALWVGLVTARIRGRAMRRSA
jgi:hypothetical protein